MGSLVPSQGLVGIFRSRTAGRMIEATMLCSTPTVCGASPARLAAGSGVPSHVTQAWISEGMIDEIRRSPNAG